jgi:hypothetical protein
MCVFVVSVAAAYRLIGGGGEGPVFDTVSRKEWNELAETGRRLGAREAPVRVVVFVDYECPFCRTFEQNILSLMRDSIPQFSVSVHDFPLPSHPSAALAAMSAHCLAERVGHQEIAEKLYAWQDSAFPPDAAALDAMFGSAGSSVAACRAAMSETGFADSVRSVAARFGVTGTPTVIIDRKQYRYPPSMDELRRLLVRGE